MKILITPHSVLGFLDGDSSFLPPICSLMIGIWEPFLISGTLSLGSRLSDEVSSKVGELGGAGGCDPERWLFRSSTSIAFCRLLDASVCFGIGEPFRAQGNLRSWAYWTKAFPSAVWGLNCKSIQTI